MRDFRLPPRSRREPRSSGILRSVYWQILNDVSVQPIGTNFRGQDSWPLKLVPIGCPETSVIIYHYVLCTIPEERVALVLCKFEQMWFVETVMLVILKAQSSSLANRTEVHFPQDGSVGSSSRNGTWTGAIRMLVDHVVDVTVADVTMTPQRVMVVDFSVPLLLSRYAHCANWIILYFTFLRVMYVDTLLLNIYQICSTWPHGKSRHKTEDDIKMIWWLLLGYSWFANVPAVSFCECGNENYFV